jgi:phage terminase large subunit
MEFASYVRRLSALPTELRRAFLEGDWNVFAGQYFSEFDPDKHIEPDYEIPLNWKKDVTIDYGLDMLAVQWIATSPEGKPVVYRELAQQNLIVSQAAERIKYLSGTDKIEEYVAPPDLWNRHKDGGRSTAEIFAEHGIGLIKAGNSRIDGWLNVKEWLKIMTFFESCSETVDHIQKLQYDTKKINDVAKQPHDITHLPDALRYWCSRRHLSPEIIKPKFRDPFRTVEDHNEEDQLHDFVVGGYA